MSLRESGDPLDKLVDALEDFAARGPDRTLAALQSTGNALIREGFDRSRAPDGIAWAPLVRKPKNRPGRRPLVKTGNLRSWASHGEVVGNRVVWDLPRYAEIHQRGSRPDAKRQLVARPILPPGVLPAHWHARLSYEAERAAIPELP